MTKYPIKSIGERIRELQLKLEESKFLSHKSFVLRWTEPNKEQAENRFNRESNKEKNNENN